MLVAAFHRLSPYATTAQALGAALTEMRRSLVARLVRDQEVVGSKPTISTATQNRRSLPTAIEVFWWHAAMPRRRREFDSRQSHRSSFTWMRRRAARSPFGKGVIEHASGRRFSIACPRDDTLVSGVRLSPWTSVHVAQSVEHRDEPTKLVMALIRPSKRSKETETPASLAGSSLERARRAPG